MYKTLWKEVMTDQRRVEYRFLHWGPFVTQYELSSKEIADLNKIEEGEEYNRGLAGHITDEYELSKEKVFEIIEPYLQSYVQGFWDYRKIKLGHSFTLTAAWINRQKKYEFNPPHTHDEDLSFVIYTKIPEGLEKECKESVSNSPGPGCIVFDFNMPSSAGGNKMFLQTHAHLPSVGDMFIFPAGLPHWVYPFTKTEGERISISGNIKFNDSQKKQI
tara:strand:+ start:349 stop:999 length:651 start_codon:yes stop_codon:yes gene_type:complete